MTIRAIQLGSAVARLQSVSRWIMWPPELTAIWIVMLLFDKNKVKVCEKNDWFWFHGA